MTPLDIAQAYYLALYGKEFEKVRASSGAGYGV